MKDMEIIEYKLNSEAILEKANEIVHYKGWIPCILWLYIDLTERDNFLKEENLFDKVEKQNIEYRVNMKKSDNPHDFEMGELVSWLEKNPIYENFVIEEVSHYVSEDIWEIDDSAHQIPKPPSF